MSLSILKSPRKRNNLFMCIGVLLLVILVLWFVLGGKKQECPKTKHKIIVPIGNGKSVALTKEEYDTLSKPKKEGFYVSSQDYVPNVRTENEYAPMLSLYKPKEPTKVEPTPVPAPIVAPMVIPTATGPMVIPSMNEPFGNVFIDNFIVPPESDEGKKYRAKLAEMSPFFLNNGEIIQA
jgi:hypothetical protein